MDYEKAEMIVNKIWNRYDDDGSGELDRQECKKLLMHMAKLCNDDSLIT